MTDEIRDEVRALLARVSQIYIQFGDAALYKLRDDARALLAKLDAVPVAQVRCLRWTDGCARHEKPGAYCEWCAAPTDRDTEEAARLLPCDSMVMGSPTPCDPADPCACTPCQQRGAVEVALAARTAAREEECINATCHWCSEGHPVEFRPNGPVWWHPDIGIATNATRHGMKCDASGIRSVARRRAGGHGRGE